MTGRERLVAASRGGVTDRTAVLGFGLMGPSFDGVAGDLALRDRVDEDQAFLLVVRGPLARFLDSGVDIYGLLEADPSAGEAEIAAVAGEVRRDFDAGASAGVDGFFYEIDGAYPSVSTPMQYGGHFLEVDRGLLEDVSEARLNVVYVAGAEEPYVDFVSDLPGHLFAWDARSGVSADEVRKMRSGALALGGEGGEVRLLDGRFSDDLMEEGA